MISRPLIPLFLSPSDFLPLTPAHFIIGDTFLEPATPFQPSTSNSKLSRWQHHLTIKQHFWNRCTENISIPCKKNQMTNYYLQYQGGYLGHIDRGPSLQWPMGRIIETYPGEDNVVRIVLVRTSHGTYKRHC